MTLELIGPDIAPPDGAVYLTVVCEACSLYITGPLPATERTVGGVCAQCALDSASPAWAPAWLETTRRAAS